MAERSSYEGEENVAAVMEEMPHNDNDSQPIPVKKLSEAFDNCAKDGMKVYLRIRPTIQQNEESTITVDSDSTIVTNAPDNSKRAQYTKLEERKYAFTRVFAHHVQQSEVYVHTAAPLLERFLQGENCVLFAYGMTNSGKTYTIQGSDENPGVFPRLVKDILGRMKAERSADWELQASMLEIYQEKLFDLLVEKKTKLSIRDANGRVEVGKLTSHPVASATDAIKLMDTAAAQRSKSTTLLNSGSSRSHAVYTLTLNRSSVGKDTIFQVVDLAGAERSNRTKASVQQQKEANNINVSLMQLWRCLQGMKRKGIEQSSSSSSSSSNGGIVGTSNATASSDIIPFRESKLTHLLMPLLTRCGLNGVAMIACVNPQIDDYDETLSILGNASLACKIKELTDLGRTATQPATATQQQHVAEEQQRQQQQQEIKMHDLKLRVAAESAAMGKKRRLDATSGTAAATNSIPVRGLKRTSANSTATTKSSGSASTSSTHNQVSSNRQGNANNTTTSNTGSNMNASNPQQQGARLKRTYNAMSNTTAGGSSAPAAKATLHMPVKGGAGVPTIDEMDSDDNKEIDDQEQEDEEEDREYLDEGQELAVTGSEVKRMRVEIHRLREENHYLVSEQLNRETEIRMEVSEEMVIRSAHLLDQIQDLQEQLHSKESQVSDVTRSVKKVRQRQRAQAHDDRAKDLMEVEDELERCKVRYERELAQLQLEKDQLEEQLMACREEVTRLESRLSERLEQHISSSSSSSTSTESMSAQKEMSTTAIATSQMSGDDQEAAVEVEPTVETEQPPPFESAAGSEEKGEEEGEQSDDAGPMMVDDADDVTGAASVDEHDVIVTEANEEEGSSPLDHQQSSSSSFAPPLSTTMTEEGEGEPASSSSSSEDQEQDVLSSAPSDDTVQLPPPPPAAKSSHKALRECREEAKINAAAGALPVPAATAAVRQATAASAFSQRMQRDQRFKKNASGAENVPSQNNVAFVLTDNDHQPSLPSDPATTADNASQGLGNSSSSRISRSPLAPVHHNSLSPSRIPHLVDKPISPKRGNGNGSSPKPENSPNRSAPDVDGGVAKKTTTFADSENTAPSSAAPAPLKPRARVVSARNVVSARLTTQASNVLAAYQAAVGGDETTNNANPNAGSYINRLRTRVMRG